MYILIIDNNKLIKSEFDNKFVYKKIVITDQEIILNGNYNFLDSSRQKRINESSYIIKNDDKTIYLFIYKSYCKHYRLYENNGFSFGYDDSHNIKTNDNLLKETYLILKDNILQTNSKYVFVNNVRYNSEQLKNNDRVDLFSFSFIYYDDFLYINDYNCTIKLNKYKYKQSCYKYEVIKPDINNYYIDTKNVLLIDKLKEVHLPHYNKNKNQLIQLGPSLTMSLAMLFLAYINIEKNSDSNSIFDILSIIIMPITMLLSTIMWPLIINYFYKRSYEKEKKSIINDYINYLIKYENECNERIKAYLAKEYNSFFYKDNILNKLFYIQKNSDDYLCISLGLYTKKNDYIFNDTDDEEVNKIIVRIRNNVNNIKNCPLKLDLKKHTIISVITNNIDYIFKKYYLELSSKYHFNDLSIAIFDKNSAITKLLYDTPHIFFNNERMIFNDERDLYKLELIDKPIVLLTKDKIHTVFSNKNIKIIYFSLKHDLLKNSDCVIEYKKEYGILNEDESILFKYYIENIDFYKMFEQLSYYSVHNIENKVCSFNDFYNVNEIENNYLIKQKSLIAGFSVKDKELLLFDLHETKDGPHGLIGGSTGSGKSELIVSLLLSLCIRYRPDYLNIIIIDYKGGGIANSLSYNNIKVPHIIGEISNLSEGVLERLIYALSFECKKRQRLFKKISELSNHSITNIDDYLEIYDESYNLDKIAHLLIIVDEFAELKNSNPEMIKQLISFSRIGRSLGIHLILATQRPGGVVDDEIWANSHFKIALKLHSEKDSQDIIKTKDAAYITKAGDYILQVDTNNIKASSLYSKKNVSFHKEIRTSLLNDKLKIISTKTNGKSDSLTEAMYYSKNIIETCKRLNIKSQVIEFEKPISKKRNILCNDIGYYVMGIADDYLKNKKYILKYPLNQNIFLYSSRENEINSIINTLNENKKECIIISNKIYISEYIICSLLYDDADNINYLFKHCDIDNKDLILIIEDINSFIAYDENYVIYIYKLIKISTSKNIKLVIMSKQISSNYKLLNSINNKCLINIQNRNDLVNFFGSKGNYISDSYFYDDVPIPFIPCTIENIENTKESNNKLMKEIPDSISLIKEDNNLLIGYDYINRTPINIDLNSKVLICSLSIYIIDKLNIIFNSYINIDVKLYDSNIKDKDYEYIIWVGDGIYKQRLFIPDIKGELSSNEAYLIHNFIGRKIRFIDYG